MVFNMPLLRSYLFILFTYYKHTAPNGALLLELIAPLSFGEGLGATPYYALAEEGEVITLLLYHSYPLDYNKP